MKKKITETIEKTEAIEITVGREIKEKIEIKWATEKT